MGVFDRQIESARRLIKKNGQTVTWRQVTNGPPADPDKPWKPGSPVETDYPETKIVFLPITTGNRFMSRRYKNNSDVPEGTLYGIMEQVDFTPTQKDEVIRDGVTYNVIAFDTLDPNGEGSIIYELELGT